MFLGEFRHSLDIKGRLVLPAKFRPRLEEGAVLTRSQRGRYLLGFTRSDFQALANRLAEVRAKEPQRRQAERAWFASAQEVDIDRAGRILIPQHLRDYSGLEVEAVVAGVNECFEVWDASRYMEEVSSAASEPDPDLVADVPELGY